MKKSLLILLMLMLCISMPGFSQMVEHVVDKGETFASIAQKYGMTEKQLKEANPKYKGVFFVGMSLNIPQKYANASSATPQTQPSPEPPQAVAPKQVVEPQQTTISYSAESQEEVPDLDNWEEGYVGETNAKGQPHGKGVMVWSGRNEFNKYRFEGYFVNGIPGDGIHPGKYAHRFRGEKDWEEVNTAFTGKKDKKTKYYLKGAGEGAYYSYDSNYIFIGNSTINTFNGYKIEFENAVVSKIENTLPTESPYLLEPNEIELYFKYMPLFVSDDVFKKNTSALWKSLGSDGHIKYRDYFAKIIPESEIKEDFTQDSIAYVKANTLEGTCGYGVTWSYNGVTKTMTIKGNGRIKDCNALKLRSAGFGPPIPETTAKQPWDKVRGEMENLVIEPGVTYIGESAFDGCVKLKSVKIPNTVTEINHRAFDNCIVLQNLYVPSSVTTIGVDALNGITPSKDPTPVNDVTFDYDDVNHVLTVKGKGEVNKNIKKQLGNKWNEVKTVIIEPGITSIGESAFQHGFNHLDSVIMANTVTSVLKFAFGHCRSLVYVKVSDNLKKIGDYAFDYCKSLEVFPLPNSTTEIGNNAFRECKKSYVSDCNKLEAYRKRLLVINKSYEGKGFESDEELYKFVWPNPKTNADQFIEDYSSNDPQNKVPMAKELKKIQTVLSILTRFSPYSYMWGNVLKWDDGNIERDKQRIKEAQTIAKTMKSNYGFGPFLRIAAQKLPKRFNDQQNYIAEQRGHQKEKVKEIKQHNEVVAEHNRMVADAVSNLLGGKSSSSSRSSSSLSSFSDDDEEDKPTSSSSSDIDPENVEIPDGEIYDQETVHNLTGSDDIRYLICFKDSGGNKFYTSYIYVTDAKIYKCRSVVFYKKEEDARAAAYVYERYEKVRKKGAI